MIDFELAYSKILEEIKETSLRTEELFLDDINFHVTAQDIYSKVDLPRFDNSSVDGYGFSRESLEHLFRQDQVFKREFTVKNKIFAGQDSNQKLRDNECFYISTGAKVPDSVTIIIPKENIRLVSSQQIQIKEVNLSKNFIRRRAEEFKKGDLIVKENTILDHSFKSLLASSGNFKIIVYKKASLALLTNGDELKIVNENSLHDTELMAAQIYEANSFTLKSILKNYVSEIKHIHIRDTEKECDSKVKEALMNSDFIVSVGGISVGEKDYLREAFLQNNVKEIFWKINIKPGKPVFWGIKEKNEESSKRFIMALPGNPVSALVIADILLINALKKFSGYQDLGLNFENNTLSKNLTKKNTTRNELRRIFISKSRNEVYETEGQESHLLSGLVHANAYAYLDDNRETYSKGDVIKTLASNLYK